MQWIIKMTAIQEINIQNVIICQGYILFCIHTSLQTGGYISHCLVGSFPLDLGCQYNYEFTGRHNITIYEC